MAPNKRMDLLESSVTATGVTNRFSGLEAGRARLQGGLVVDRGLPKA
jgi:hypothetical protein